MIMYTTKDIAGVVILLIITVMFAFFTFLCIGSHIQNKEYRKAVRWLLPSIISICAGIVEITILVKIFTEVF